LSRLPFVKNNVWTTNSLEINKTVINSSALLNISCFYLFRKPPTVFDWCTLFPANRNRVWHTQTGSRCLHVLCIYACSLILGLHLTSLRSCWWSWQKISR
jgi:hypothetical protein